MEKYLHQLKHNYLEESEDEDDFEITDERKFMKDVNTYIDCKYSDKFKMWIPIEISNNQTIEYDQINNSILKKNK